MAILNGDIVLERIYLGEYSGKEITQDSLGIVMSIENSQVLVYWFDRKSPWGTKERDYEYFDLNNIRDKAILEDMINEYNRYKQANRAG